MGFWIKIGDTWNLVLTSYKKDLSIWTEINQANLTQYLNTNLSFYDGEISGDHTLSIGGLTEISGVTCSYVAVYDNRYDVTSAATWAIVSGTQHCHSDDFLTTTTRGNNPRHDIEYQMWLHEGHIAAIKNYPELLFTAQWQLFDIAVANRNEGYIVCLDGENATTDDNLRRLNNKGLVERDHITKKDTFYLYKAWWNPTPFVHICGKDYTKTTDRAIKCYTNDGASVTLYVNGSSVESVNVTDNIAVFSSTNFSSGDVVLVSGSTTSDTFTFE